MTPPVSTSDRLNQFGLGQEVLRRAVSGGVVGLVAEPAAVDHADPCGGQAPGRISAASARLEKREAHVLCTWQIQSFK